MKRFAVCFAVSALLGPIEAGAQEPVDLQAIARIKAEGLERSQVLDIFGALTDVFGPRLTATPAYKAAANWAAKSLEAWGMENVHLESWEFGRGWTLDHFTLEMVEPRYFPMIGYPEAWTPP
ncbi:MAG: peptidase M28, partial [Gemmatimonadetes bacterium]|nr:peptidase M28 [Gemmatimonadota bacterium]